MGRYKSKFDIITQTSENKESDSEYLFSVL